jgi:hypothetical protein
MISPSQDGPLFGLLVSANEGNEEKYDYIFSGTVQKVLLYIPFYFSFFFFFFFSFFFLLKIERGDIDKKSKKKNKIRKLYALRITEGNISR